ncbi:MAG: hypothetical protein K0U24_09060 [Gammaproteobacteria bacterium]|nr:hypothetical protein [Gammaproteobacteria bacterium]MCH9764351.1 hypothetical protein [Gammaproteobacteria bacterium]
MRIKEAAEASLKTGIAIPNVFVGTCFGTLFAPSSAAAAGGASLIIGATGAGLALAFLPSVFFSGMAALSTKPNMKAGFSLCAAASLLGGVMLGGAMFGLSAGTLLPFIGLGAAISALSTLITIFVAQACINTLKDAVITPLLDEWKKYQANDNDNGKNEATAPAMSKAVRHDDAEDDSELEFDGLSPSF